MLDAAPGTAEVLEGVADGVASVEVDSVVVETLEEVEVEVVTEELIDSTEVDSLVVAGTEVLTGVGVELTLAEAGIGVVAVDTVALLGTVTLEAGGTPGVMVAGRDVSMLSMSMGHERITSARRNRVGYGLRLSARDNHDRGVGPASSRSCRSLARCGDAAGGDGDGDSLRV